MIIKKKYYTLFVFLMVVSISSCQQKKRNPNIVVFLADDLGYADVSWNNPNAYIETPNLDLLVKEGGVFTSCYSSSSMCSPSRAGLLTGRVPTRVGIHDWIKEIYKKPLSNFHLPEEEITFAEKLKQKNYRTGVIGKWHLNNEFNTGNHSDPGDQGFDYWYCTPVQANPSHQNPTNFYDNGKAVGKIGSKDSPIFSSDVVANKSIDWLQDQTEEDPFLLYVPFHEPHVVCDAPTATKAKYLKRIKNGKIPLLERTGENGLGQAEYYGCVENMDKAIGRIIAYLKEKNLYDNSIILFSSDNGPDSKRRYKGRLQSVGQTGKYRGRKRWILEGGIRQATVMVWNGVIPKGSKYTKAVGHVDLFPTLMEAVGIETDNSIQRDGVSLLSYLKGESLDRGDKLLHWHFHAPWQGPQSALRKEDWVITAQWNEKFKGGRFDTTKVTQIKRANLIDFHLYNTKDDPAQLIDVKSENVELFEELKAKLISTHKEVKEDCPSSDRFQWNDTLENIVDKRYSSVRE